MSVFSKLCFGSAVITALLGAPVAAGAYVLAALVMWDK